MQLEWEQVGSLDDWRLPPGATPVPHQDGWAAIVESSDDDAGGAASVQLSSDGIEWQRVGLPGDVPAGSLATDGEWLVAEGEGSLWVGTGDGTWDEQLDDQLQAAFVEAGPAGVLALGLKTDGSGGVWRLEDGTFVDTTPEGLDDIDVGSLGNVSLVGLPDTYVVRLHYSGPEEATQEATDWSSPDGIVWSESPTEDVINPGGNLIQSGVATVESNDQSREVVLVNTDSGLWRLDRTEAVSLGQVTGFPENGAGLLNADKDAFIYLPPQQSEPILYSLDGYQWLQVNGPPITNPNPDVGEYGFLDRHVIRNGTELITYDSYGDVGMFGWVGDVTTNTWTAPTPNLP